MSRAGLPVLAGLAFVAACSDLTVQPAVDRITTPIANPSFRADIAPILAETCASANACHSGPNAQKGQRLDPGFAYASLVNVASAFDSSLMRVKPAAPDSSFFYLVMSEDPATRRGYYRMPVTERAMPAAVQQTIRNWIVNGAPNN